MIPQNIRDRLRGSLDEINYDLSALVSQGVINNADYRKIRNQAQVSYDAMVDTATRTDFNTQAQEKLLDALLRDFEVSTQRLLDRAVARKGINALLIYRLDKVDRGMKKMVSRSHSSSRSSEQLLAAMSATRSFIFRLMSAGMVPRLKAEDVQEVAKLYRLTLEEFVDSRAVGDSSKLLQ